MSPIGKIFLLINFGLAFGFLFWASTAVSANAKWKAKHDEVVAERTKAEEALKSEISNLNLSLTNERDAKDARMSERDQAQAEASRQRQELDAERRANEQLRGDIAAIKETLASYDQSIQALQAAKDAAIAEARGLERERDEAKQSAEQAEQARADAQEALAQAQAQIAELEKSLTSAQTALASTEAQLESVAAVYNVNLSEFVGQPDIEGRVLQVDRSVEPGLVALNVGSSSGVKRGMTFQIFNGGTYKGYVRVENVHNDMSSALIMGQVEGAQIAQGDSAATNL
jgi:chromosome segregation ATPase